MTIPQVDGVTSPEQQREDNKPTDQQEPFDNYSIPWKDPDEEAYKETKFKKTSNHLVCFSLKALRLLVQCLYKHH